jgi:phosphatidylglycerophosphate synthase
MVMSSSEIPAFLRAVDRVLLIMVSAAAVTSFALVGLGPTTWGVVVGGSLGILNFAALKWLGAKLMGANARSRTYYASLFMGKLTALMGVIALCLALLPITPLGFLVGISLLFPAIMVAFFWRTLSPSVTSVGDLTTGTQG